MIHQELLRRAIPQDNKVLIDFVETLSPKILRHFAAVPALGGSGAPRPIIGLDSPAGLQSYTGEERGRFSRSNPDQSMATHLLNGIFAAMRLAEKLPPSKVFNDEEKRLWILGYICHDYTKIYGIKVSGGNLPAILSLIAQLGEFLNFSAFMPDWKDYLGDIAFLAQNTQTKEGSNLEISKFDVKNAHRVSLITN
jgi:CRISPR-associated protein Csc3